MGCSDKEDEENQFGSKRSKNTMAAKAMRMMRKEGITLKEAWVKVKAGVSRKRSKKSRRMSRRKSRRMSRKLRRKSRRMSRKLRRKSRRMSRKLRRLAKFGLPLVPGL